MIYGDGEQTRDFVYVEDVVEANLLAAEAPGGSGEVFNVASSESLTVNAARPDHIDEILGRPLAPVYAPERGRATSAIPSADIGKIAEPGWATARGSISAAASSAPSPGTGKQRSTP